jgi:hypothetical protein
MKDITKICAQCLTLTFLLIGLINDSRVYLFMGTAIFDLGLILSLILVSRMTDTAIKDNALSLPPIDKVSAY